MNKCLTPGAVYETRISPCGVSVTVRFPEDKMVGGDITALEKKLHDALENAVADHFIPYACGYCGHDEPARMGLYEGQDWPRCPSCQGC